MDASARCSWLSAVSRDERSTRRFLSKSLSHTEREAWCLATKNVATIPIEHAGWELECSISLAVAHPIPCLPPARERGWFPALLLVPDGGDGIFPGGARPFLDLHASGPCSLPP